MQIVRPKDRTKICTEYYNGKIYDGTIYKETMHTAEKILVLADRGYRWMQKQYKNVLFPYRHAKDEKYLTSTYCYSYWYCQS